MVKCERFMEDGLEEIGEVCLSENQGKRLVDVVDLNSKMEDMV